MEFIVELLVEIVLEGTIAIGSEKKVPMPIRILCAFVEWIIFFGFGGLLVYMGYESIIQDDTVSAAFSFGIGVLMIFGGVFIAVKMFRKRKENKNHLEDYYGE